MYKWKQFIDFDREEQWLNDMAHQGYLLNGKGWFRYHFLPYPARDAVVRVDFRDKGMSREAFDDYRTLFADAGWQHIAGRRSGDAQYFAAVGVPADADIFSDRESRAARYRRSIAARTSMATVFLLLAFVLIQQGHFPWPPSTWYQTPGIWEAHGAAFWGMFWFETPFVLLRVGGPVFLLIVGLVYLIQAITQGRLMRRASAI